jgi:hypothetical protein
MSTDTLAQAAKYYDLSPDTPVNCLAYIDLNPVQAGLVDRRR